MKIRLCGNTLRLRLNRTEVKEFSLRGMVEETTSFGSSPDNRLLYALAVDKQADTVKATFDSNRIQIHVPEKLAKIWTDTDQVGFQGKTTISGNDQLSLLVEKDFQCLHERPGEDDSLAFPNPLIP